MTYQSITRIDLRRLILALTIASALISLANTFYASYQVQRQQLIENTLESNHAYATKLAASTEDFISGVQQQLKFSAAVIAANFQNKTILESETKRLRLQTDSFNSVMVINRYAEVLATSPDTLQIKGLTLETPGAIEAIKNKKPSISQPYVSTAGNLLIFISHPIILDSGEYAGAVGGTIYLKQASVLNRLLGKHYYNDGSYIYVADQNKRIIYHPDIDRVGIIADDNSVIDNFSKQKSGKAQTKNSQGTEMLAGYALVTTTGWGIVAQRPKSATLAALDSLMLEVISKTLPIALLSLLMIWWCAKLISNPLRKLADSADAMDKPETEKNIQDVKSWYFESSELKRVMLTGIGILHKNINKLKDDVHTDPLTGLGNRRSMDLALSSWKATKTSFSVLAIDIDFFKHVNDTFGHDVGDIVLQKLAQHMRDVSRADDVICRIGGEEFLMLLPSTNAQIAAQVAERLRALVESSAFDAAGKITISLGVANWPDSSNEIVTVLKAADEMLYKAKKSGRNRVEVLS
ncbi:sensor domain-containing diguanylate cyclase [Castellaniella sp.]|uniref:sensor domain-containing diguanylate cyclase n=1 Tax=Castellaniella sp. TaxID=1955812 RepID=UPI002AFFA4A6|nr:sensor domain-containing diguanylate cyclase [Castellaniella sp.]